MAFILDDILLAPINLVKWIGEKVCEAAEKEATDESQIEEELLEFERRGEMRDTQEVRAQAEDRLLAKLDAIRSHKENKKKESAR